MHKITETWFEGNSITAFHYYPVPKRVVLAKSRDCNYFNLQNPPYADEFIINIRPINANVNIYAASASLHDILRTNFFNNFAIFKKFFHDFAFYASPDFTIGNLLLVSKKQNVVIRIKDGSPNAEFYSCEEFFRTKKRFEKTSYFFDTHNGSIQDSLIAFRK